MDDSTERPLPKLAAQSVVGGLLMGLANLVPGISGGTMLLAAGVYPDFIGGIAELTTAKFRMRSMMVLGIVVVAALISIVLFAGPVKELVVHQRWAAYSLFIGLTLGGVPVVRGLMGPMNASSWGGAVVGFIGMAALAIAQSSGAGTSGLLSGGPLGFLIAGAAAASAMILPGVSGGYLLLVLGMYVPILSAVDQLKEGLKAGDLTALADPVIGVVAPVGVGVVIGVVAVSNALKWFLDRYKDATLGLLLGLLVGAVVGLWPFQAGVQPQVGDVVKGQALTTESLAELDEEDWPTAYFSPSPTQIGGSLLLLLIGLGTTTGVAWLGSNKPSEGTA